MQHFMNDNQMLKNNANGNSTSGKLIARMVAGRHGAPKCKSRTVADGSTFIAEYELYLNCSVLSAFTPHKVLYNSVLNNGNT